MDNGFEEVKRIKMTLCLLRQGDQVLLGMKKRGFGQGRWNGFGGKVHSEEGLEEAAAREVLEECGVSVRDLVKFGELDFRFRSRPGEILEVHLYKTESFEGEPQESEEMLPQWFHKNDIPFDQMWPDDIFWFPLYLTGKTFTGSFLFGDNDVVIEKKISVIDTLNPNENELI